MPRGRVRHPAWFERTEIERRYREGETLHQLAARYGVSNVTIHHWLKAWGVKRRGRVAFDQTVTIPREKTTHAYLAGLIDGEGSIVIVRPQRSQARRPNVHLQLASTTRELHDWLLATFGGRVYERQINHLGTKPIWYWHVVRGRDIRAILRATLPYMIIKREAAKAALKVVDAQVRNANRNLAELND